MALQAASSVIHEGSSRETPGRTSTSMTSVPLRPLRRTSGNGQPSSNTVDATDMRWLRCRIGMLNVVWCRRRFTNTNRWPESGSSPNTLSTRAWRPLKLCLISVGSTARNTRVAGERLNITALLSRRCLANSWARLFPDALAAPRANLVRQPSVPADQPSQGALRRTRPGRQIRLVVP
jgi:hypothetical protein